MADELSGTEIAVVDKLLAKQQMTLTTYKAVLSIDPPKSIVKHHDYGKFDYLPITAVERMLDGLFNGWRVEVLREGSVVNGFYVVVRLTAYIPESEKAIVADGIGFAEFQTVKSAAPTDFTKLIQGAGVLAVPKAKAEAIKNAAKSFGNLFGRNLARNDDNALSELELVSTSRDKIANTLKAKNETN